ncbi:adenine nucleotide alpha hydrolases-like protein [Auriculariales sp. MPI-PUGE-AT-0066]|nr:adenine nucleotide alpha hydrolases-like protein [Auriculariales sp. MPI-PUGE-AT-0066]
MKFVGLLSGGKDSCYNLMHCAQNGHVLIAAATLGPGPGKEEIDSYLYQTVGQDAIDLIAQALEVPLYRRVIVGSAIELGNEYGGRTADDGIKVDGDETEDLFELLSEVKAHHPDVQGVAIGAILSTYQRVRMEQVCRRLELTPLCYLWRRDQRELLKEMIDAGMESILIKVAGIGLTTKHLGQSLAQMQPLLWKLLSQNDSYGLHVCGEGGEYETMTLDCPLFKSGSFRETQTVVHSDSAFATVAYLKFTSAELVEKPQASQNQVTIPPLLDEIGQTTFELTYEQHTSAESNTPAVGLALSLRTSRNGRWLAIANVSVADADLTFEDQVSSCFSLLKDELVKHQLSMRDIASIDVALSSMELFPRLNAIYAAQFGTNPLRITLSCVAFATEDEKRERQALHVQGLSYWAPANIGPYSQAIRVGGLVFVSGQIGLVPASLSLPEPRSLALETALSLQHVRRVLAAIATNGIVQAAVCWLTDLHQLPFAVQAFRGNFSVQHPQPVLFVGAIDLPKNAAVETHVIAHNGVVVETDEDGDSQEVNARQTHCHCLFATLHHDQYLIPGHVSNILAFNAEDASVAIELFLSLSGKPIYTRLFHVGALDARVCPVDEQVVVSVPVRFIATPDLRSWQYAIVSIGSS